MTTEEAKKAIAVLNRAIEENFLENQRALFRMESFLKGLGIISEDVNNPKPVDPLSPERRAKIEALTGRVKKFKENSQEHISWSGVSARTMSRDEVVDRFSRTKLSSYENENTSADNKVLVQAIRLMKLVTHPINDKFIEDFLLEENEFSHLDRNGINVRPRIWGWIYNCVKNGKKVGFDIVVRRDEEGTGKFHYYIGR